MGQYYRPVLQQDGITTIYNRDIDGNYTMAKLTEHSWWNNSLMNAVSEKLYQKNGRLLWCGDYAEDDEIEMSKLTVRDIWDIDGEELSYTDFRIDGLFLCNHDTKEFIDLDKYKEISTDSDDWCLHPLSLLTAIGNGRGGGDYYYSNQEDIGIWAWNIISFENTPPEEYKEFVVMFKEAING